MVPICPGALELKVVSTVVPLTVSVPTPLRVVLGSIARTLVRVVSEPDIMPPARSFVPVGIGFARMTELLLFTSSTSPFLFAPRVLVNIIVPLPAVVRALLGPVTVFENVTAFVPSTLIVPPPEPTAIEDPTLVSVLDELISKVPPLLRLNAPETDPAKGSMSVPPLMVDPPVTALLTFARTVPLLITNPPVRLVDVLIVRVFDPF